MNKRTLRPGGILLLISLFLAACHLGSEVPSWKTDLLAPIAKGHLTIGDALGDSLFETNGDNVLQLVYRDTLGISFLEQGLVLPDTGLRLSVTLDTLSLDSDTISERRDLRSVATELANSTDPATQLLGILLLSSDGDTLTNVPPIDDFGLGVIPVDASEFFNYAELKSGTLTIEIVNEFPVGIDSLIFEVRNVNLPGPPLLRDTFVNIAPYTYRTESYDLAGKTVESSLEAELTKATLDSAEVLPVNLDDYVELRLIAEGLQASYAEAVFPDQDLVDTLRKTTYEFGGDLNGVQITRVKIRSGRIEARASSTVQDSIQFAYLLESAFDGQGDTPLVTLTLPPATPGTPSERTEIFDLNGFTIDLSDDGTSWNTLQERIRVSLRSSGNIVTLSDEDSVEVFFGLLDLEPTYVEGYLGEQRIELAGTEAIDLFDKINLDRIRLTEAEASIVLNNSVGIPAEVELKELTASSSRTGEEVSLVSSDLVVGEVELDNPVLPDTFGQAITALPFTPDNSNLNRWLSVLPNEVRYDLTVVTNPDGFLGLRDNFATDSSKVEAYLDFVLPLSGVVDRLILRDTLEVNWESLDLPEQVSEGTLYLLLDNQFPIEAKLNARLVDEAYGPVAILAEEFVLAAGLTGSNGQIEEPTRSVLEKSLSREQAQSWPTESRYLILEAVVNTAPQGAPIRIFADYGIEAALTVQFDVELAGD